MLHPYLAKLAAEKTSAIELRLCKACLSLVNALNEELELIHGEQYRDFLIDERDAKIRHAGYHLQQAKNAFDMGD